MMNMDGWYRQCHVVIRLEGDVLSRMIPFVPKGIFILNGIFGPTGILIPHGIVGLIGVLIPKGIFALTPIDPKGRF